jgi:hypothetical protein
MLNFNILLHWFKFAIAGLPEADADHNIAGGAANLIRHT